MPQTKIKLVVFDLDGTLLDTFEHIVQAFTKVLPQYGVKPDRETIRLVIGKTLIDCYRALAPEGDHEAMARLHHESQQTPEMYDLIVAYDFLRETLDELKAAGVKVAVQTNRGRESVDLIFDHTELTDLFDAVVTPEEITHPKPHPEGIQMLCQQLKVSPNQAIIVGDTRVDIETGRAAGVAFTVGVTHGFGKRAELKVAGADHIIDSLEALPALVI